MSEIDNVSESDLIAGFVKWANVNRIPVNSLSYEEIYEYICRYLKAAG